GHSADLIDATSAQAVADSYQAESVAGGGGRIASSIAPFWSNQSELRAAIADIASVSDIWLRMNDAGKIEFGRWARSVSLTNVTDLGFEDVDSYSFQTEAHDKLPN